MPPTQPGASQEAIAQRLEAWAALHRQLPASSFFALHFPALKDEGLAIMTSRDFLALVEAMQALLARAGVRGLAALAQQQRDGAVGQLAAAVVRGERLPYAEGFVVPVCCACGKADTGSLLRCGNCRTAGYCSKECQRRAWGQHKKVCPLMAAEMDGVSRTAQRAGAQAQPAEAAGAPAGPAAAAESKPAAAAAAGEGTSPAATAAAQAATSGAGTGEAAAWAWSSDPATRRLLLGGGAVLVAAAAAALAVGWWRRH